LILHTKVFRRKSSVSGTAPSMYSIHMYHEKCGFDNGYTYCYTITMKTAISISDEVFQEAEQTAQQLGLSRSRMYSMAIVEFIQSHNPDAITAKLNEVYSTVDSRLDDDLIQANYDLLSQDACYAIRHRLNIAVIAVISIVAVMAAALHYLQLS
jgi:hypothetical protein